MSLLDHAPTFTADEASRIGDELYGLQATATLLPSERDQNFLLSTHGEPHYVLKIANGTERREMLEAQNQVMEHLGKRVDFCPRVVPTKTGESLAAISTETGETHFVRLVTYLPGIPMGESNRHSSDLLLDLGRKIGQLSASLQDFEHPALRREFHWDLARGAEVVAKYVELIVESDLRETVARITAHFEREAVPLLADLRRSVVYNDANDYNLLVGGGTDLYSRNQQVVGVIDFGDMVHSYTVGDLAVAVAYAMLGKPDPLPAAAQIVRGYHQTLPLTESELEALFPLVRLRLCMSACLAAEQMARQPQNEYLGISQAAVRKTLPRLEAVHPRFATAVFREACDLTPHPRGDEIVSWLDEHTGRFASLLDRDLQAGDVAVLDQSVYSPLLSGDPEQNQGDIMTTRITAFLADSGAPVGIGRYNEARYPPASPTSPAGFGPRDQTPTVHLGIDLFASPGIPVNAPLGGTVHALAHNRAPREYGPVVLLEHAGHEHPTFYTLYRHLSRTSLEKLKPGQKIKKGEKIGEIGEAGENGNWTPHLHFQIILDPLDDGAGFPGAAAPNQREVWLGLCPDPNLIVGIPPENFLPHKPSKTETLSARQERLGSSLRLSYRNPVKIVRGWKQYLFDDEGRRYLDAYNNVAHVGHSHPRVVAAIQQQAAILNTNTRYLHDAINQYAEKLTATLPDSLSVCFFLNSGSEANELALRLARAATRQRDLIVLEAAYHGHTTTLIDISPYKHNGPGGLGSPDWVHAVPLPDDYRGPYKREDPQAGRKYAQFVLEEIDQLKKRGRGLRGFIAESLPSVGGQIILPPGYLKEVYRHVRAAGGVCIADEVQTGFGRVGTHFWGFEKQAVEPDILVLGKPIGNGHPLSAVITTREIAEAFDNGMEFFSTFGGNPVSCRVGLAVLEVVLEENLQEHAREVGAHLLQGLTPLRDRFPIVGDVRGAGLFLGVELVRDRETREPAGEEAAFIADRMRDHGILLGTDGPYHNVVKIRPPMPFNIENADRLIEAMQGILHQEFMA